MFWIDVQSDFPTMGNIIRLRDETRYVQDLFSDEMSFLTRDLSWAERRDLRHKLLQVLCDRWFAQFGERVVPVPPEGPGIAWGIAREEEPCLEGRPQRSEIQTSPPTAITTHASSQDGN